MYGIFTNICPKNHPNVGKYSIHGSYGYIHIYIYNVLASEGLVNSENVSKLSTYHLRPVGAALFRSAAFCCEDHLIWKTKNIICYTYTVHVKPPSEETNLYTSSGSHLYG